MKKIIIALAIIIGIGLGFIAGYYTAIHNIVDVQTSAEGFQVNFADGTGYWYECAEPQTAEEPTIEYDEGIYYLHDGEKTTMLLSVDNVAFIKLGEYDYWELMLNDDYRYDHFVAEWEQETGWKAQRNGSAEWIIE